MMRENIVKKFNESIVINSDGRFLCKYKIFGDLVRDDYKRYKLILQCDNKGSSTIFNANNDEDAIAQVDAFVKSQVKIIMNATRRIGGYPIGDDG